MDDIFIYRGDTQTQRITATQNKTLLPLNGYTVYFTVMRDINDISTTVISKSQLVASTPATTECLIKLTGADTSIPAGNYTYEAVLELAGEQMTMIQGKFTIGLRLKR
jgi:hypothetical protein